MEFRPLFARVVKVESAAPALCRSLRPYLAGALRRGLSLVLAGLLVTLLPGDLPAQQAPLYGQPPYPSPQDGYAPPPPDGSYAESPAAPQDQQPIPYEPLPNYRAPDDQMRGYGEQQAYGAPEARYPAQYPARDSAPYGPQESYQQESLGPGQLQQLVAPIALYPDGLIAQILAAATYPMQVAEADRWRQSQGDAPPEAVAAGADAQQWDPSVKALTAFPQVLGQLDQNLEWTTELGNAYYNQPQDLLEAVQTMRQRAASAGNLQNTPQQTVTEDQGYVQIAPANPQIVYVPAYDPWTVYGAPVSPYPGYSMLDDTLGVVASAAVQFGVGMVLSAFTAPWSFLGWGLNWLGGCLTFDREGYYPHSPTLVDWGLPYGGPRAWGYDHGRGYGRDWGGGRGWNGYGRGQGYSGGAQGGWGSGRSIAGGSTGFRNPRGLNPGGRINPTPVYGRGGYGRSGSTYGPGFYGRNYGSGFYGRNGLSGSRPQMISRNNGWGASGMHPQPLNGFRGGYPSYGGWGSRNPGFRGVQPGSGMAGYGGRNQSFRGGSGSFRGRGGIGLRPSFGGYSGQSRSGGFHLFGGSHSQGNLGGGHFGGSRGGFGGSHFGGGGHFGGGSHSGGGHGGGHFGGGGHHR